MTISLKRHKIFFPHFIYCTIRSTDVILFYIIPNVSFSSSLPPKVKNPFSSCTISIESECVVAVHHLQGNSIKNPWSLHVL
jgi:hypothetical protein